MFGANVLSLKTNYLIDRFGSSFLRHCAAIASSGKIDSNVSSDIEQSCFNRGKGRADLA